MLCISFLSCPGNVDVQLTRLCWMACAWIAWNVVWNVPLWGPRFAQPRRFRGLPVWAIRAEPTNVWQQTDAMPRMPLDWFVMWGSCCFCLNDEGCDILEFSPLEIVAFEKDFDGFGCGCCDSWGWPWLQQLNQLNQLSLCSRLPGGHVFELRARLLFFRWALPQMPRSVWSQCNPDLYCTCPCTGPCAWCSRLAMGAGASSNPTTSKGFKCIDRTSEGSSAALVATLWLGDDFHFSGGSGIQFVVSFRLVLFSNLLLSSPTGQGQLWAVLAVLAGKTDGKSSERSPFWELPYVQTIQFSVSSLKGAFNLQCRFEAWAEFFEQRRNFYNIDFIRHSRNNSYSDGWCLMCSRCWYWNLLFKRNIWPNKTHLFFQDGATVRFVSALVAPVFPLVVFLCCLLVEVAKPGLGIAGGLQDPGCSGGWS